MCDRSHEIVILCGGAAIGASLAAIVIAVYGSPQAAARSLKGDVLFCAQPTAAAEKTGEAGSQVRFDIQNLSFHTAAVSGVKRSCGCVRSVDDFPLSVEPLATRTLNFAVSEAHVSNRRVETIELITETADRPLRLFVVFQSR